MKKLAITCLISIGMFIIAIVISAVLLAQQPDAGLADIHSLSDLMDVPVTVEYLEGQELTSSKPADRYLKNTMDYYDRYSHSSLILLVTPTDELQITNGTIGQTVIIDEVIRGKAKAGSTCRIWVDYGLQVLDGVITFRNRQNLMQEGKQYLVFLQDAKVNRWRSLKEYMYTDSFFGCIPADYDGEIVFSGSRTQLYRDLAKYPNFVLNQETASAREKVTKKLLQIPQDLQQEFH